MGSISNLEYQEELHSAHNAYPEAPESLKAKRGCRTTSMNYRKRYMGVRHEVEKLVPDLRDKTRYVLRYRNLQLYW